MKDVNKILLLKYAAKIVSQNEDSRKIESLSSIPKIIIYYLYIQSILYVCLMNRILAVSM